jgi:hypothetical protein
MEKGNVVRSWLKLVETAKRLNIARDRLRAKVEEIAGCDLSDWSFTDVMRYTNLIIRSKR